MAMGKPGGMPPVRQGSDAGRRASADRSGSGGGWWFWGILIAVVIAVGRCSSRDTSGVSTPDAPVEAGTGQQALAAAVAEQAPPPVAELSASSVRTGTSRLAAVDVEGLSGDMIFSQNCYAVIGASFDWGKLDECGAFDAAAVAALGDETPAGLDRELAWFDGEAAAGRYLKAATAAGMDPDVADGRLDALRARVARRVKPQRTAPSQAEPSDSIDAEPGEADPEDDAGNVVATA